MCLLSFYPAGAEINVDHLRNGSECNSDGFGWGIVTSDAHLDSFRSMDFEEALARFIEARAIHPEGDALFHSRYSTHGVINVDNCHPFPVGRNGRTRNILVGHNGILSREVQPIPGDRRSDTRIFAEDFFLGRFKDLDNPATITRLERWLTGYNKLVILTVNPAHEQRSYILNADSGVWVKGVWHSNDGYIRTPYKMWAHSETGYTFAPRGASAWSGRYRAGDCVHCGESETIRLGMCTSCLYCEWCGEEDTACVCYSGGGYVSSTVLGYPPKSPKAITAKGGINSVPLDTDPTVDTWLCGICDSEASETCCAEAAAREMSREPDLGMSEVDMEAHWERLMAEYEISDANASTARDGDSA